MKNQEKKFYFRDFIKILLVISIFSTISIFWYINQQRDYFQQYTSYATELRLLTQSILKYSQDAVSDRVDNGVFESLKISELKINSILTILTEGKKSQNKVILPASPDKIQAEELYKFLEFWKTLRSKIDILILNEKAIRDTIKIIQNVIRNCNDIQEIYWETLKAWGAKTIDGEKLIKVARQIDMAESIIDDLQVIQIFTNNAGNLKAALLERAKSFLKDIHDVCLDPQDPELEEKLKKVNEYFGYLEQDIQALEGKSAIIETVHTAALEIFSMVPVMSTLSKNIETAYLNYPKKNIWPEFLAYVLGLLSFCVLLVSIYLFHKETNSNLKMIKEKNQLMQFALQKLLQELPLIASGNVPLDKLFLEQETDVMISETFSYMLHTLRKLVYDIGQTAQHVSEAALNAQTIAETLATSSSQQAEEIVGVSASMNAMTASIEVVSKNATESAAVALESVNIALEGGTVVRSTIVGMDRIQNQIQETSTYMRRLGESSQEIGEFVSLIEGIADQTNILSLNASIQAAMAGDAGKGFAVVADEVQRLAEKVSHATKEIGTLVRSIQAGTSQVLIAMEQTSAEVIEGVQFAQAAGSTLEKIETVSRRLSDLIQGISVSATQQTLASHRVTKVMHAVKDTAKQTAERNMETVGLITKLMQVVTDLKDSVFELKLPTEIGKVDK